MSVAFSRDLVSGTPTKAERLPTLGWHNLFPLGEVSASSFASDHAPQLAFDGYTSTSWRTSGGAEHWIETELDAPEQADYAAIAAHTLANTVVSPQYHDGSAWQDAGDPIALLSGSPAVWLFPPQAASRWRLEIVGAPTVVAIGALHIGRLLRPDTGLRAGWEPPSLNEQLEYTAPISVGGQLLPRHVRRRGVDVRLDLPQLGYDFARGAWQEFLEHAHQRAFFFWLLFGSHAEVVYGGLESHGGRITRAKRADLELRMVGIAT